MKSLGIGVSCCALIALSLTAASAGELSWRTDYHEAYAAAQAEHKMLFIYFEAVEPTVAGKAFAETTLADERIQAKLADYVLLRVPTDVEITIAGESQKLLQHGGFQSMRGEAGIAMIDLAHKGENYYAQTVTCVPFERPAYFAPEYHGVKSLNILLDLPAGSLTQRTMVYAVRCHPESAASTKGRADKTLMAATASHSQYQANITTLGHHHWDSRFQRLYAQLGGTPPSEVCAQSWQGETLLAACFSAVDSWRHSPGHWSAVSADQPAYGYDIRRGRDGNWYATGIFGGRRS